MELRQLNVSNFRNIPHAELEFHSGLNVITGANGSGKTSLLEAIYSLGRGGSFKTSNSDNLIQFGKKGFTVTGSVLFEGTKRHLGIQRTDRKTQIRYSGQTVHKASQLSNILPLQIIEPRIHSFFDQGPEVRRRFLEWGVFHVEPGYKNVWRTFRRILLQRNAALKLRLQQQEVIKWDNLLVESAIQIDAMRRAYIDEIVISIDKFCEEYAIDFCRDIEIEYHQGWKKNMSLDQALSESFYSDQNRGFTQSGPHRADIQVKLGKSRGRDFLSRGQQKLFINLLYISQSMLLKKLSSKSPLLLIDDVAAELDSESKELLKDVFASTGCQTFLTATSLDVLDVAGDDLPRAVFHVEHGCIEQVV